VTDHEPACANAWPPLFDLPEWNSTALQICDQCPVRFWCLNHVDPARSYFDGVAGGHTWHEGRLKCRSCLQTDPILIHYMDSVTRTERDTDPIIDE